jgi:hypothetical protein
MTRERDPIDVAAMVVLRRVLEDLEAGRIGVLELAVHDSDRLGLALRWGEQAGPLASPSSSSSSSPLTSSSGPTCPDCHSTNVAVFADEIGCNACGTTWPLPPP